MFASGQSKAYIPNFEVGCVSRSVRAILEYITRFLGPALADPVERTVIEYSDRSLTSHYYG